MEEAAGDRKGEKGFKVLREADRNKVSPEGAERRVEENMSDQNQTTTQATEATETKQQQQEAKPMKGIKGVLSMKDVAKNDELQGVYDLFRAAHAGMLVEVATTGEGARSGIAEVVSSRS